MTLDFDLLFSVNRKTDIYELRFTDQTIFDVAGTVKGFYRIEYPDGLVVENTDTDNPDFTDVSGATTISLRLKKFKLITGTYVITQKIYIDEVLYSLSKNVSLTFLEPSLTLTNSSNVATPTVSFLDTTNHNVINYAMVRTREITCAFPASTGVTGSLTTINSELFMVASGNYYEGLYLPKISVDSSYIADTHTVQWIAEKSYSFDIRRIIPYTQLLSVINEFKANSKNPKSDQDYQMIMSLYSHILGKVNNSESGVQDLIDELLEIATGLCKCEEYDYTNSPLIPFTIEITVINSDFDLSWNWEFTGSPYLPVPDGSSIYGLDPGLVPPENWKLKFVTILMVNGFPLPLSTRGYIPDPNNNRIILKDEWLDLEIGTIIDAQLKMKRI